MSVLSPTKLSAHSFLQCQDPPGYRFELVNGEIIVSPSPNPAHSYIDRMLTHILITHIQKHDLGRLYGDVDTIFDNANVRRPDILFFRKDRLHLVGKIAMEGPPDLCIEILSPSSATTDLVDKFELYEHHGVPHYWIVDPKAQSLDAYSLKEGKYTLVTAGKATQTLHLPPFPDLPIPLAQLWP